MNVRRQRQYTFHLTFHTTMKECRILLASKYTLSLTWYSGAEIQHWL